MAGVAGTRVLKSGLLASVLSVSLLASATSADARTTQYPSDSEKPVLTTILVGFRTVWRSSGDDDKRGRVISPGQLQWNDRMTSWINQHATEKQQFRALQDSKYLGSGGTGYDQSITIADGLGRRLGDLYAKGRINGLLPRTAKLLNTTDGLVGKFVDTDRAKAAFGFPRPYLRVAGSGRVAGDSSSCSPSQVNSSALSNLRKGRSWADSAGNLRITRVASATDTTRTFASTSVQLDPGYGRPGLCLGGSFPSGHTTAAYSAGVVLATLLPELAPSILARTSEAGNNRIVLGVHYPLDVIGGRMAGEAAAATRWSDRRFRKRMLEPARAELVRYLEKACGDTLVACMTADKPYTNDPFGGPSPPLTSSQSVTGRTSAVIAYTERLGYGFAPVAPSRLGPSVPPGAENLLRTAFPTLTSTQRRAVLAQTETDSGHALDTTSLQLLGLADGSWQRLNLAAAMSATVLRMPDGSVVVLSVGAQPTVIDA